MTTDIRRLVADTFARLGLSCGAEPIETILIRDGIYCGRRFDVEHGHAVWFIEEEQLKFFRASGSLALVIEPVVTTQVATRRAA
jgi:predicted acylesterase/phospholipase RssA